MCRARVEARPTRNPADRVLTRGRLFVLQTSSAVVGVISRHSCRRNLASGRLGQLPCRGSDEGVEQGRSPSYPGPRGDRAWPDETAVVARIDTGKRRGSANIRAGFSGISGSGPSGRWSRDRHGRGWGTDEEADEVGEARGHPQELGTIARRGATSGGWSPGGSGSSLFGALGVMSLATANTSIVVCLGDLVNSVNPSSIPAAPPLRLTRVAASYLAVIAGAYLVRECMNVLRRYLVEKTCTRINKDMCVRLVGHLMKVDLSSWPRTRWGAVRADQPAASRGLVRFLRLTFLDFVAALFTGVFALAAAFSKQPWIALVMVGVVPAFARADDLAAHHAERDPARPDADREVMDGTVVEPSGESITCEPPTHDRQEVRRVARTAERQRSKEIRHHSRCRFSVAARRSTRGSFTSSCWRSPSTCSFTGRLIRGRSSHSRCSTSA